MFIRKASLSDLDAIVRLDESFSEEFGEPVYSEDQWFNFINGGEHVICCQGDGDVISVLLALENHDGSLQLQKIFVAEDYREQEIGYYLMEQFSMLQEENLCTAFLSVAMDNTRAQKFYKTHGFAVDDEDDFDVTMRRDPL